ncbi:hypothetical protein [Caenibius sp. WL]|uniref:hypothetical protein n=1 Tax=Caenibius sp. WL TaxID=2872646 RepID=UPI0024B482A2|nr:hypothetical protein [Caenibius sp. WL]
MAGFLFACECDLACGAASALQRIHESGEQLPRLDSQCFGVFEEFDHIHPPLPPFYPADKALIFAQAPGEIGLQYAFFPPRVDKRLDENRVGF